MEETTATNFKTDDTSLATFLSLSFDVVEYRWEDRACFWYFENTDDLAAQVRDYTGGSARVDPRKYSAKFAKRKSEMFNARQQHRKDKQTAKATRAEGG